MAAALSCRRLFHERSRSLSATLPVRVDAIACPRYVREILSRRHFVTAAPVVMTVITISDFYQYHVYGILCPLLVLRNRRIHPKRKSNNKRATLPFFKLKPQAVPLRTGRASLPRPPGATSIPTEQSKNT